MQTDLHALPSLAAVARRARALPITSQLLRAAAGEGRFTIWFSLGPVAQLVRALC